MKSKRIFSLAVACTIFTSTVYAHSVTILKSESKISPGSHGGAEITRLESYPITESKKKILLSSGRTSTKVSRASGRAGTNIRLDSDHSFEICNSEHSAGYFKINAELKDDQNNSNSNSQHTLVGPQSCANGNLHIFLVSEYRYSGSYRAYGYTDIDGSNRSSDYNTIDVTK